ncbi:hypothetical protein CRUP_016275 [Coryphaenoides rupestris]|nr:hypothetical protein CRUP_016275 [Coryphaenoides rupestris]
MALCQLLLLVGLVAGGAEPLRPLQPIRTLLQEKAQTKLHQALLGQELARPHHRQLLQELVLAQPHLVHDMGRREVRETARSSSSSSSSQANATQSSAPGQGVVTTTAEHTVDVVEVMERMVHLHPPSRETQETQEDPGDPGAPRPPRDGGPGRGVGGGGLLPGGLGPSFPQASPEARPGQADGRLHAGLEEVPAALVSEAGPVVRGEGEGQASGNGVFRSPPVAVATAAASSRATATVPAETETGTDFGAAVGVAGSEAPPRGTFCCLDESSSVVLSSRPPCSSSPSSFLTADERRVTRRRRRRQNCLNWTFLPRIPQCPKWAWPPVNGLCSQLWRPRKDFRARLLPLTTDFAWDWLGLTTTPMAPGSEVRGGGVTELHLSEAHLDELPEAQQVVCMDWSDLASRGYVFLNISHNMNCLGVLEFGAASSCAVQPAASRGDYSKLLVFVNQAACEEEEEEQDTHL